MLAEAFKIIRASAESMEFIEIDLHSVVFGSAYDRHYAGRDASEILRGLPGNILGPSETTAQCTALLMIYLLPDHQPSLATFQKKNISSLQSSFFAAATTRLRPHAGLISTTSLSILCSRSSTRSFRSMRRPCTSETTSARLRQWHQSQSLALAEISRSCALFSLKPSLVSAIISSAFRIAP